MYLYIIILYIYRYIYSQYVTLLARCHTVANGATHVLMPTAGDWSRQVSCHDLATLRPLTAVARRAWVDATYDGSYHSGLWLKCLKPQCWKTKCQNTNW